MRKAFGGCLASNTLMGFASAGREVPESAQSGNGSGNGNGDDNFHHGRSLSAEEDEDGPWSDGSDSGEEVSSSDDEEDTKEAEDRRVEALYNIATGGDGETAPVVHKENTAAAAGAAAEPASVLLEESTMTVDTTTATKLEQEAAPAKTVSVEEGTAAPCSEPEVIPLSALPALAKDFAVADTPSEEPPQPDLATN